MKSGLKVSTSTLQTNMRGHDMLINGRRKASTLQPGKKSKQCLNLSRSLMSYWGHLSLFMSLSRPSS